tara:strand:+ start:101 stop:280 length:180 start_codon:yes stop_codon:yes gene_type:complete
MEQLNIKIMSKECKRARNTVSTAFIVLLILVAIMSMTSCASANYNSNPAYAGWNAGCGR